MDSIKVPYQDRDTRMSRNRRLGNEGVKGEEDEEAGGEEWKFDRSEVRCDPYYERIRVKFWQLRNERRIERRSLRAMKAVQVVSMEDCSSTNANRIDRAELGHWVED